MRITLKCEVVGVKKSNNYNYSTSKYEEKISSQLSILKNNDGITGTIELDGKLSFGGLHQIIIDTLPYEQVVTKE